MSDELINKYFPGVSKACVQLLKTNPKLYSEIFTYGQRKERELMRSRRNR